MTRPQTPEEWEAAVRGEACVMLAEAVDVDRTHPVSAAMFRRSADRLLALLPPAKERVPWPDAFGRMIGGWEVTNVTRSTLHPDGCAITSIGEYIADSDGMVGVDAL